jgi:dTDP-4-dehydrorhamnose reductase
MEPGARAKAARAPVLVLGGRGLLGSALADALRARGRSVDAPPRAELDVTDRGGVERWLDTRRPTAVVNAAAFTDVRAAEHPENRPAVLAANRDAPGRIAEACARRKVYLVHVSTDFVFDGEIRRPYREDDPTAPIQVYGESKRDGERRVLEACPGAAIVRTSTLYGPGRRERPHYVDAILRQARERRRLVVVATPVASPTLSTDLAEGILALVDASARGLVHVVNAGRCSRLELAREIVRLAGRSGEVTVEEGPEEPGPPRRPVYSVLDCSRFEQLTATSMRSWQEALADYVGRPA